MKCLIWSHWFLPLISVIQTQLVCWSQPLFLQGCLEFSGKHDKGGGHEELCRRHSAGRLVKMSNGNWMNLVMGYYWCDSKINSHFLRFWKPSQSQMKCLTLSRSWATSTPRSTEMVRRLSMNLKWTGDPSRDHLHSSTQVQLLNYWITFAKGPLMTDYHAHYHVICQCSDSWWIINNLHHLFFVLCIIIINGSRPHTEAKNGRQVFKLFRNSWCVGTSVLMLVACKLDVSCPCKHSTARCATCYSLLQWCS